MTDVVDGSFVTPEGRRKLFVSQRPGESDDAFTTRMMQFMLAMENAQTLDVVLASAANEWKVLPSHRWLDAVKCSYPRLCLRVTALSSTSGGLVGHLVVECDEQLIVDGWGDLMEESVYVPRAEDGRIKAWQATLWRLTHEIRGMGDQYDACFERSGMIVD